MAEPAGKTTLEALVTRYRREVLRGGEASPELEIRFHGVDYPLFAALHAALLARVGMADAGASVGPPVLTQMVSAVMDAERGDGPRRPLAPSRLREIFFAGGQKTGERYATKTPLLLPYRVAGPGLPYVVALSAEKPEARGFSSDEGALLRVKARASFPLTLAAERDPEAPEARPRLEWRADLTVTRQLAGSDARGALPVAVNQMFRGRPPMTAATLLAALGLEGEGAAARQLYRYEAEVEFLGPAEARGALRPADVCAAAGALLHLANPEYVREAALQAEVYRVARLVARAPGYAERFRQEMGLKRLLPQALAITRADYRALYPPVGLYLTDKADGRRGVALVREGQAFLVSDTLQEFQPPGSAAASETAVDGEIVDGADGPAFYGFDVIALAGARLADAGFEARQARLGEAIAVLAAAGIPAEAKPYVRLASADVRALEGAIRGVYEARRPYETDGLIFVEGGRPYGETATYKWKSARDNTIDFLARRAPPTARGPPPFADLPGHELYFLFVGITPDLYAALGLRRCAGYEELFGRPEVRPGVRGGRGPGRRPGRVDANTGSYFPIQFAPSDAPLAFLYQHPAASPLGAIDGQVVEARCAGPCAAAGGRADLVAWELVRVRTDRRRDLLSQRYYGNDFYAAELIWLNYVDPFPVEQLWEGPALDYFQEPKADAYRAQTAVLSYAKTRRILELKHAAWVVDVGAGKGQDLGRYLEAEVGHLVAVDRDPAALSELVRRKFSHARKRARGGRGTTIHVLLADATAPHALTLDRLALFGLARGGADALVCNLAVHYFLGSVEGLRNFVALARGAVKPGGRAALTALRGEAVHALFEAERIPEGGSWDVREDETLKYSLRRLYSSETLEAAGQRIGVLLPFSSGQYYEEFLVNTRALAAEFEARGFALASEASIADSILEFEARNRAVAALLTPGDRRYLALYHELVFRRTN
jgi:SAM-dependent methyltransferase